jgi:hypothetical protein
MLAMTAAIHWVVEDNHGGPAEAAGPAGTTVIRTIRPLDGRPSVDGEGHGPAAVADRRAMAATAGPRLPGRLLGEVVGVDAGVDGVQHRQSRVVDRPGGELDRVSGVGFRPICLAGGTLGIPLVGPPVQLRVEVVQPGGGVGLQLGPPAAGTRMAC